eukprot:6197461-Pleurochrysis_carterae.AAC.2
MQFKCYAAVGRVQISKIDVYLLMASPPLGGGRRRLGVAATLGHAAMDRSVHSPQGSVTRRITNDSMNGGAHCRVCASAKGAPPLRHFADSRRLLWLILIYLLTYGAGEASARRGAAPPWWQWLAHLDVVHDEGSVRGRPIEPAALSFPRAWTRALTRYARQSLRGSRPLRAAHGRRFERTNGPR